MTKFQRIAAKVLVALVLLSVGLRAQNPQGSFVITNDSFTTDATFYIDRVSISEGSSLSSPIVVTPGKTVTVNYEFDPSVYVRFDIYRSRENVVHSGPSLVVGASTGDLDYMGHAPFEYPPGPYPSRKFTVGGLTVLEDARKTVWATDSSMLNGELFREGVDKVIAAVQTPAPAASGGGSSEGDPAADSHRETVATYQLSRIAPDSGPPLDDFTDLKPEFSKSIMMAAGETAYTEVSDLFPSAPISLPFTMPTMDSSAPSVLTLTFPATFGGAVFDLNPFRSDRLGGIVGWFRAACLWLALALLGAWMWKEIGAWIRAMASVQQAKGNPVLAGTGAQATALAAAALMTAAIVVAVTALIGFGFDDINPGGLIAGLSSSPWASLPSGVYWMLNTLLPCSTLMACLCVRVTFNVWASTLFAACSAVVRFIVP